MFEIFIKYSTNLLFFGITYFFLTILSFFKALGIKEELTVCVCMCMCVCGDFVAVVNFTFG